MDLTNSVFWTANRCSSRSGMKVFVGNQVLQILKVSKLSQRRHVDATNNPADVASRGLKDDAFLKNVTWVSGLS